MNVKLQRRKNLLTVRELLALPPDGANVSDGDRLSIRTKEGKAFAVFRYLSPQTRQRREAGFGALHVGNPKEAAESLARVRAKADLFRALLDKVEDEGKAIGVDPLEDRDQKRTEAKQKKEAEQRRKRSSLIQCARDYHQRAIDGKRSTRHGLEWIGSLSRCLPKSLLDAPVDSITPPMLFEALAPVQERIPETAGRIRQRLQKILADAEFRGLVKGNAAAAIRDKLVDECGPRERSNYRALDYKDVPPFMATLREHAGVAHRLLEFTILCACRTNESRLLAWSEVDLARGVVTLPAARMKAKKPHVIALPPRALEIVLGMRELQKQLELTTDYVFGSTSREGRPLSGMAMLMATRKMGFGDQTVTHGFRSSFSDWAYTHSPFRAEIIESCLAHVEGKGSKVKRAYLRTSFPEECAKVLRMWHDFVLGDAAAGSNVVPMRAA